MSSLCCMHRWSRLLEQQLSITFKHLLTKKNNLPFSVFISSKQTEVCHFHFLFAENKWKLPFSVSSFLVAEFLKHGDMETWRWRHGNMETGWHRDIAMEFWCCMKKIKRKRKVEAQTIFFYCLPFMFITIVYHLYIFWWRNNWKLSVCKQTKPTKWPKRTKTACSSTRLCIDSTVYIMEIEPSKYWNSIIPRFPSNMQFFSVYLGCP